MLKIRNIVMAMIASVALFSCGDELSELNIDPNEPTTAPAANLLTQAEYTLANTLQGRSLNAEWGMLMVQQFAQNEYTEESRYSGLDGNSFDFLFNTLYASVLNELDYASQLVDVESGSEDVKQNKQAIISILKAYTFQVLTDGYGPIPYTQALNSIEYPLPAYDSQQVVYEGILMDLKTAVDNLDESVESFSTGDVIYNGDVSMWKKFGNSLLLRAAMRVADIDSGLAQTYVGDALAGAFTSTADNANFYFNEDPSLSNPLWADQNLNNRDDFAVTELLVEDLKDTSDPRLEAYVALNIYNEYTGMPYGLPDADAFDLKDVTSRPNQNVRSNTTPHKFITYSEVEFLKAEAIERGWASGSASSAFGNAIEASFEEWGVSDAAYVSNAVSNYSSSSWDQSIGYEKWKSLYMNGYEAWAEWRRLDYPSLSAPAAAFLPVIPLKLPMPISEQTNNTENLNLVTSSPNDVTVSLWWDVD